MDRAGERGGKATAEHELARLGGLRKPSGLITYTLLHVLSLLLLYQLLDARYLEGLMYLLAIYWILVLLILLSTRWLIKQKTEIKR